MPAKDAPSKCRNAEELLIERARTGDRAALEALLLRYQETIYRFGTRMCGHPEDAAEVVQDTLLTAARAIRDFRGEGAFSTWVYRIARSFCSKKRRRSKFAPKVSEQVDLNSASHVPDQVPTPDEIMARREIMGALNRAIAALPERFREVFLLRDLEGLSTEETAKILGLRPATVKTRLHRARLAIRDALAPVLSGAVPSPAPPRGCPDVALLLSRHLEGELSPRVCARMEEHLQRCEHCRDTCETLRQLLAVCKSLPAPPVPAELQEKVRHALRAVVGSTRGPSTAGTV